MIGAAWGRIFQGAEKRAQPGLGKVVCSMAAGASRHGAGAPEGAAGQSGRKKRWRQADVERAVAAAEQAGLESYRVEVAPDGTISVIVGMPPE
jgi:hypothetical protein